MSFQPPPPPAGPPPGPGGPPNYGGAPNYGGTPNYGGNQLVVGPPSGSKKGRSPLPWIIGAVVLVIAAVVVVVLVAGGGGGGGVDTDAASDGLSTALDDAEFDETGYAALRDCPFGDVDDLADQVADHIDASDELLGGDTDAYAIDETDALPQLAVCSLLAAEDADVEPASLYFSSFQLKSGDDYADAVEASYGDDVDVNIDDPTSYEGGQIYTYCADADGDDLGCGADWVHDDGLVIGLSVGVGPTADDAGSALRSVLSTMADGLAAQT